MRYRPTCHYAYHPCDDAVLSVHELAGKNWELQADKRLMMDEIIDGIDELGVLLMGNGDRVYWYGSRLSIDQTRRIVPHNNATSLQVTRAVLAGMVWAIEHPPRRDCRAGGAGFRAHPRSRRTLSWRCRRRVGRLDSRSAIANGSFPKTSTARTHGSSRTSASSSAAIPHVVASLACGDDRLCRDRLYRRRASFHFAACRHACERRQQSRGVVLCGPLLADRRRRPPAFDALTRFAGLLP